MAEKIKKDDPEDVVIRFIVFILGMVIAVAAITLSWNQLISEVFNLPKINVIEAFALFVVIKLLR